MTDLAARYLSGDAALRNFYGPPPASLFERAPHGRPWSPGLAAAIARYHARLGKAADYFAGNEPLIITGQQPGLFTGPLYTIYKAATAIKLAAAVRERTGAPCLPLYWVASEDHDFEEVRTAHFLDKRGGAFALRYEPETYFPGMPMHRVPVEASLHTLIDEAARRTRGSEWRAPIATFLHESLEASESLADWHARIMARLFRDTPLLLFTPQLGAARRGAASVMRKAIEEPLLPSRLVNEAGQRLEALGFGVQVVKDPSEAAFFLEMGDCRRKVIFRAEHFVFPEEQLAFSPEEILLLLDAAPERFSPNVALRPLVQQTLFPAAAYVAGPGELAYWGQLKDLFRHYELEMPVLFPRASGIITSLKLTRLLRRFGFEPGALEMSRESVLERALQSTAEHPALAVLQDKRRNIEGAVTELLTRLAALPLEDNTPDLASQFAAGVTRDLNRLEHRLLRQDRARVEALRRRVDRLRLALRPEGRPQDRHYNIFSFLFSQGWELIPRIIAGIELDKPLEQEIQLCE